MKKSIHMLTRTLSVLLFACCLFVIATPAMAFEYTYTGRAIEGRTGVLLIGAGVEIELTYLDERGGDPPRVRTTTKSTFSGAGGSYSISFDLCMLCRPLHRDISSWWNTLYGERNNIPQYLKRRHVYLD